MVFQYPKFRGFEYIQNYNNKYIILIIFKSRYLIPIFCLTINPEFHKIYNTWHSLYPQSIYNSMRFLKNVSLVNLDGSFYSSYGCLESWIIRQKKWEYILKVLVDFIDGQIPAGIGKTGHNLSQDHHENTYKNCIN